MGVLHRVRQACVMSSVAHAPMRMSMSSPDVARRRITGSSLAMMASRNCSRRLFGSRHRSSCNTARMSLLCLVSCVSRRLSTRSDVMQARHSNVSSNASSIEAAAATDVDEEEEEDAFFWLLLPPLLLLSLHSCVLSKTSSSKRVSLRNHVMDVTCVWPRSRLRKVRIS